MRLNIATRARIVVALGTAVLAEPATATPPLEAFGRLPSVGQVTISPDGRSLALVVGDERQRGIQIRDTASLKPLHFIPTGQTKIRGLSWAGDHHLVIAASSTATILGLTGPRQEYLSLIDFNLPIKKGKLLLDAPVAGVREKLNTAVTVPEIRIIGGKPVAFIEGISFPANQGVRTLFRVDLDGGWTHLMAVGSTETNGWMVDDNGAIVARVDYRQANGAWNLYTGHSGHLAKSLTMTRPLDAPWLAGTGRTPDSLLVGVPGDGGSAFHEIYLGGDHLSEPIAALAGGDPVHDRKTRQLIGVEHDDSLATSYTFFAPADAKIWSMVARAFPKALVELASWSDDRSKIVLKVEGKDHGAAYYLLDMTSRHAKWLADEYAGISPADVAERQAVTYPAADGLPIPAYLTLPPGRAPKNLPLIVLPHGGPGARDDAGFDWWSQALASRGYAVLQPQFRGSTGFTETLHAAGYGEWGKKMQTDLSDGVKYLAAAGTVDARRVCIAGASYGGYAALAGVTLQSGIYRCAISLAGPSDLRAMLSAEVSNMNGANNSTLRFWKRFMGAKSPSDPALDAISPARLAARADVPVLLIHGVDDTVVPFAQSKNMAAALTRAGNRVELITLRGEDHWLSRSETRLQMLNATAKFLAANLPVEGDARTAAAPATDATAPAAAVAPAAPAAVTAAAKTVPAAR